MAKKKILVVDDEEDMAMALKVRLKANGYDVVFASDSAQGFAVANDEKPDLILLDIRMPGEDGFALAEQLKQSVAGHRIPIIFLTGIPGGEERAFKLGALGYLMKPYQPEELLGTIRSALQINRRQSRESMGETMSLTS
jgi:DNA-binding response OmpR family regulator